jgi:hypothetical protein
MSQNAKVKRTYQGIAGDLTIAPYLMSLKQISDWVNSMNSAYSIINPNRRRLYELYENISLDAQVITTSHKRRIAVTNKKIEFIQEGKINEELRECFQTPWFWKLLGLSMDALFWSHSLIELKVRNGEIYDCDLVPRINVRPDFNDILYDPNNLTSSISFAEPPESDYLLSVSGTQNHKFGLYASLAPYVLYKRGSLGDWAQFCELFGLPFREVTYDPFDPNSRNKADDAMKNMGGAGYVILPQGTSVKIHDSNKTGSKDTFDGLARFCDEQITKAMLGQTMTTDNGSSRSQGEVHERAENDINMNDIIWIEYMLNWDLKNKLIKFGFPLQKGRFQFEMTKEIPLVERIDMDIKLASQIDIPAEYWYETYNIPEPETGACKIEKKETPPSPPDGEGRRQQEND